MSSSRRGNTSSFVRGLMKSLPNVHWSGIVYLFGSEHEYITTIKVFEHSDLAPTDHTLKALVNTVNDAAFIAVDSQTGKTIQCQPGECLFLEYKPNVRKDGTVEIVYRFAIGRNLTNHTIPGSNITIPEVRAWDHLGIRYDENGCPIDARVYRLIPEADFSQLGI